MAFSGRMLDATYVQFLFQNEVDLLSVQRRELWLFNNWFVANHRWEPAPVLNFVTTIDLWVQMRGIPLLYVCEETALEIAHEIGEIITLDFHDATMTQIAYIRVRVRIGITDRLRFFQRITFDSGETALIRFQYERLRRICSSCFRVTHHRNYCPYRPRLPNYGRERAVFHDERLRSSMNSQSQMTESSFPAPVLPPPRIVTPPLNHGEFLAAHPNFPAPREGLNHQGRGTYYQGLCQGQQVSTDSNITPSVGTALSTGSRRVFEVGQSSRGVETRETRKRQEEKGTHDEQDKAHMKGGILNPPKKR
ncbi:hypothetical protein AtEden1_Chr3g0203081 [Arabidopsis thaliana]|uniref:Ta11-like non-LTR retrotransposon n=3 Tax=Arabidopsis thaliana TaxID=3702 RepID=Q1PEH5_ARATH|nr:hypothetical protein At3g47920 [Arabidopsis thaliana]